MAAEIEKEKIRVNDNQSPSNSQGSSTHPLPSSPISQKEKRVEQEQEEEETRGGDMEKGGSTLPPHNNNNNNKPHLPDSLQSFTAEEVSKYDKYEADYASYLRAKFFSNKNINGGDIFDLTVTIGNEPIKASRVSPTRLYADPQQSFVFGRVLASGEEMPSASGVEPSPNIPNGSQAPQKKSS